MNEGSCNHRLPSAGTLRVVLFWFLVWLPAAWADTEIESHEGIVGEVQLVDASALGEESFLILSLQDGTSFLVPGQRKIAASAGVKVAVRYLPPGQVDELGQACTIRVLGLPITVDGEEVLQLAQRPFEIYVSDDPACVPVSGPTD